MPMHELMPRHTNDADGRECHHTATTTGFTGGLAPSRSAAYWPPPMLLSRSSRHASDVVAKFQHTLRAGRHLGVGAGKTALPRWCRKNAGAILPPPTRLYFQFVDVGHWRKRAHGRHVDMIDQFP